MATTLLPDEFESGVASRTGSGEGRLRGLHRAFAPLLAVRGLPRWLFWTGATITLLFVVLAVFAPEIAPYGFNQYIAHGIRFLPHPIPLDLLKRGGAGGRAACRRCQPAR